MEWNGSNACLWQGNKKAGEMKREKIWELKKNAELKEKVQYIGLVHILEWKKNQNKTENEVESTLNCKSNQQERKNSLLRNEVP